MRCGRRRTAAGLLVFFNQSLSSSQRSQSQNRGRAKDEYAFGPQEPRLRTRRWTRLCIWLWRSAVGTSARVPRAHDTGGNGMKRHAADSVPHVDSVTLASEHRLTLSSEQILHRLVMGFCGASASSCRGASCSSSRLSLPRNLPPDIRTSISISMDVPRTTPMVP